MKAYGGTRGAMNEEEALSAILGTGVTLFDAAEMHGSGNSEQRLGEPTRGSNAIIAKK